MIGCIIFGISMWAFVGLWLSVAFYGYLLSAHTAKMTKGMTYGERMHWQKDERAEQLNSKFIRRILLLFIPVAVGMSVEYFGLSLGLFELDTVCPNWMLSPEVLR